MTDELSIHTLLSSVNHNPDSDPFETQEWLDALESVIKYEGKHRAHFLIETLLNKLYCSGAAMPYSANTPYLNTIPPQLQIPHPADLSLEARIRSLVRWNALAMVVRANRKTTELGGHIATFASAATLYDVGFNHFFHAPTAEHGGDLIYFQGHAAPGIYARAFLEGRLTEQQLEHFRQEIAFKDGLSSYPHPWLMPDFWQFPTVSMGLGPMMAIYQAHFLKYLHNRQLLNTEGRKVWAFMGDGEMDEPESLGAIALAGREKLDNLIFVINCNLQRLDGPVRGNGKIIQELEADFRGSGWNVIKVIWGTGWDALLARDSEGWLRKRMEECVDGEYQNFKAKGGAYTREHFFGKYPQLKEMVADMTDEDIGALQRGGHDPCKVYAAYAAAVRHTGQPTVILAKTVKGYGMGAAGEGQNITHQQKKMNEQALREFKKRFHLPIPDEQIADAPFFRPAEDSAEMRYLQKRRAALGGYVPQRRQVAEPLSIPSLALFDSVLKGSGEREQSTTMVFVRLLTALTKEPNLKNYIVPIVADESRTFGMEGMFRQLGIYSSVGQLYEPQDADQLMYYREEKTGQILQEGINEAGAFSSWIAAGTAYSCHGLNMIPFFIYYSMFGFQRVGDLAWAAGDIQARGFLMGGTAGRTTLAGEGLQHQDGHSVLTAGNIPNCMVYDPTFGYEMAVIMHAGLVRMYAQQESIFYYIMAMNENYQQPAMLTGDTLAYESPEFERIRTGILKGLYLWQTVEVAESQLYVQLLGSGAILREVIAAGALLASEFNVNVEIWSAPSFTELRREGLDVQRWNMLHPEQTARIPYVTQCLQTEAAENYHAPVIAATDFVKLYPDQIRAFIARPYLVLGTDGFGRSDTRVQLRQFFEVNRYYVVIAALFALAQQGKIAAAVVTQAMQRYDIDAEKVNPLYC